MPYIGNIVQDFSVSTAMLNTDSVTSIKVLDGTIVNADINASAAIAGSKISPTFTSNVTIQNATPILRLEDSNHNSDFELINADGVFSIKDATNSAVRMTIDSTGQFDFEENVDCNSGLDVTGNITATGDLTVTGGDVIIQGTEAKLHLTDTNNDDDFLVFNNNGTFKVYDATNNADRLQINSSGVVTIGGNTDFGDGIDVTGAITSTGKVQAGDDVEVVVSSGDAFILTKGGTNQGHLVKKADNTTVAGLTNGGAVSGSVNDAAVFAPAGDLKLLAGGSNVNSNLIVDVTSSGVEITGTTDGVLNLDTSDSRGAFVRFGQGGSFHNMVGCADGLITGLDKEDLGIRATDKIGFSTNGDDIKMIILSGGDIGIGTTSPSATIHVANADPQFRLQRTGDHSTTAGPLIQFQGRGPNTVNYNFAKIDAVSTGSNNAGNLRFFTNASGTQSQQMIINDVGTVGINSNGTNFGQLSVGMPSQSGGAALQVMNSASGGGDGGTANIVLRSVNSNGSNWAHAQYRAQSHQFQHQGTTKVNINSNGLCFNNDTAASNALDDYEEGAWTPSVTGTTSNLGSTSGRSFQYRKIGNIVFFTFDFFQENNNMSIGSDVVIDGLPFDSSPLPNNFISNVSIGSIGNAASNHATVTNYINNGPLINILTAVSSSRHFMGQGFYITA